MHMSKQAQSQATTIESKREKLIEIKGLCKHFDIKGSGTLKAIDNVTFDIYKGEILGLVGESGCGKTTLGRTIKGLYPANGGEVLYRGNDIGKFNKKQKLDFTKQAQMIFQDPYSSLNPRMTVAELISEGMEIHHMYPKEKLTQEVNRMLELVGLNREHASRFPHEFSGGQRQRVGIARSLAVEPEFVVCDEPISALDVSIQAQIVNLFKSLREQLGLTYLFVAHDLSMVKYISDRVAVMYLGKIVEITSSAELYKNPQHPYTEFLLSAIPIPDPEVEAARKDIHLEGELPSPINLPKGCSFADRCKYATAECAEQPMLLLEVLPGHFSSCTKAKKSY